MARTRKAATKAAPKSRVKSGSRAPSSTRFKCPECGKKFDRPAALGAHRRRAHGVAGVSSQARASAKRRSAAAGSRGGARSTQGSVNGARRGAVNRDALLQALFPNGVPAREEVIRSVKGWLDEAERLTRL